MQNSHTIYTSFIIIFALLTISGFSQDNKLHWLIGDGDHYYMHPVWSPNGSKIAFTGSNYKGLWVMQADGSAVKKISDEAAAGWGFEWSADSESILTRVAKFNNHRRLNAVKYFEIADNNSVQLTEYMSIFPGLPHWIEFDRRILLYNKNRPRIIESQKADIDLNSDIYPRYTCFLNGTKIGVYDNQNGKIRLLDPLNAEGYLNPTVSKDGSKIAFEKYGGNLYVMNTDGSNITDLGIGYSPDWSPDNKKIVFTITEDNGYRFTSSDLYIIDIHTLQKTNITNSTDKLEMHPDWSPDGKRIIFDDSFSGQIYLLEL